MEARNYWEENGNNGVKYDNGYNPNEDFGRGGGEQLNFAKPPSEDEAEFPPANYLKKGKVSRQDPMSHRIIEKRRRDRMNNCLADLSRLIPPEYLKKGRGRVEKTEIIEMAIRHLTFLQDRANGLYHGTKNGPNYAAEKQVGDYRAGYQEAVAEATRYLVEMHGYASAEGLSVQLAAHLHRHCDRVTKGETPPHDSKAQVAQGSSSEATSSSNSSASCAAKAAVIAHAPKPCPPAYPTPYEPRGQPYPMECDRVPTNQLEPLETELQEEPLPLDGRRQRDATPRTVRKPDQVEDFLHTYKFKNCIERRFSKSQDTEAADPTLPAPAHPGCNKAPPHKRRRAASPATPLSTSTSNSSSAEEATDTSPQDTSSDSPPTPVDVKTTNVPIFALNAQGKYYVPLSVNYSCLARYVGSAGILDAHAAHVASSLHPVTIHVNFHPYTKYHVKSEPAEAEWRPA